MLKPVAQFKFEWCCRVVVRLVGGLSMSLGRHCSLIGWTPSPNKRDRDRAQSDVLMMISPWRKYSECKTCSPSFRPFRVNLCQPVPSPVQLDGAQRTSCRSHTSRNAYGLGDEQPDVDAVYKKVQRTETNGSNVTPDTGVTEGEIDGHADHDGVVGQVTGPETAQSQGFPQRFTIILLCFVAFMLCNMDRVNMSIAILPMQREFGWNSQTLGIVQSSFFWGYLLTQVVGGIAADRLGGKLVLGLGVVWWSMATVLTPMAAHMSLPVLLGMRALMGIGEGVAMPAMNNMLSRWVPASERSRSLALVYSGMYTGSMLGLGVSPGLIASSGWPSVFYIFGGFGVVWWLIWTFRASSTPAESKTINPAELKFITANTTVSKGSVDQIPWRKLLSRKEVWAIILSHFCHNWGVFILLTWMPTYYADVLGFDLASAGLAAVYPWLCMAVMANVGGWIADAMVSRGVRRTIVRKLMQTIGFMGPAIFLTQLQHVTNPVMAILCMCACQGLDAFSQSGLYSNHQDIGPKYAGVLLGLSNTAGVLAGVISTAATGYILASGTWNDVWSSAIFFYIIGTFIWNLFATGDQIFD
eukprot:jgi/Ulvmu1/5170/UM021_0187.1